MTTQQSSDVSAIPWNILRGLWSESEAELLPALTDQDDPDAESGGSPLPPPAAQSIFDWISARCA